MLDEYYTFYLEFLIDIDFFNVCILYTFYIKYNLRHAMYIILFNKYYLTMSIRIDISEHNSEYN